MLAIYIASKNPRDTSCNSTEIQDGGQNSKWQSAMYNCISLILNYKVDPHVKMYYDEYIEIKCISFKLNENQDGRQILKCLPKTDRYTLSQVLMWTTLYFVFGYRYGSFMIYFGNIYSSKSDGTQVSLLLGIQDGGQDSKWLPPMCRDDYSSLWTKSR